MPYTIDDFAIPQGWILQFCDPPDNDSYPKGSSLTITKNPDGTTANLVIQGDTKGDIKFSGVPFESEFGRLNGTSTDPSTEGYKVTVTIIDPNKRKIVGWVQPPNILPLAGTWGADANGVVGKKP